MKIACLGGGPGGLYFAICMKLLKTNYNITVFERNKPNDTFGWGVVLSDETLENLEKNDPISAKNIKDNFAYWDDIALHHKGEKLISTGHGFCGIGRKSLLNILQDRARDLGINLIYEKEIETLSKYENEYDIVIAADGLNSIARKQYNNIFNPEEDIRNCQFIWLGTKQKFNDAFTFIFEKTNKGWVWAHAYQFDKDTATFIVECSQETYDSYGFGTISQEKSIKICEKIFSKYLNSNKLMSNANHIRGSAWIKFPRVLCDNWFHKNIVLLGDAAATAHFSIGSGTKLALESAINLANNLVKEKDYKEAFLKYQNERKLEILRLQSAAKNSLEWFENVERYLDLDPIQLKYSLLTRSQRISHENLRLRDPVWLNKAEKWFQKKSGQINNKKIRAPMFAPLKLRELELKNRIVVSPMAQYKAVNGVPNDWHLVHYGERAKGGAGLICVEMTCVSAEGRITPGCTGIYNKEQTKAWKRITNFIHKETDAKICCQIGHSGRKGSTQLGWEEMDVPLTKNNWEIVSPSPIPWSNKNAVPREISTEQMKKILNQFISSTIMANKAGFDMIELHAAHGYLISSFISPKSNIRTDKYGGSLENRMRYPLEIAKAMRTNWPKEKPMSVRISANDWLGEAGITPSDSIIISKLFSNIGIDIIDVSAGQTSLDAKPIYGRMFQTPFSDKIKNETGLKTMAVGNIYEPDHVNSILMAGRADLVCLARPHLSNPYWTLHAGTIIGDREEKWPNPYLAGRDQMWRLNDKENELNLGS